MYNISKVFYNSSYNYYIFNLIITYQLFKRKEAVFVSLMDILKCLKKYSDVDNVYNIIHMFYGMEVGTHRKNIAEQK